MHNASIKPSTGAAYTQHWNAFVHFLTQHQLANTLPASSQSILLFLAHLHEAGRKYSTIRSYASAISFRHKLLHKPDPCASLPITKLFTGILNIEKTQSNTAGLKPITKNILHTLLNTIPFITLCPYTRAMIRALFLVTYYACLRAGEAVISNDVSHTLHLHQVQLVKVGATNSFHIHFRSYKHSNHATPLIVIPPSGDNLTCPVIALSTYLRHRGSSPGPIFLSLTHAPITRDYFTAILKQAVVLAGYQDKSFNTHSFRIGRATQMAMDNVPDHVIKATGRWKTNAFLKYIRIQAIYSPS